MNKFIVTTTINTPTEALKKFTSFEGWQLIVVGDKKTPHDAFSQFPCIYIHPDYQEKTYKDLSDAIGWNCIQRRNIGFIEAYKRGADIVASVDDDNIPYKTWGQDLLLNRAIKVIEYTPNDSYVFDPLSIFDIPYWHRGFPLSEVPNRKNLSKKLTVKTFDIQADLWDGAPDVDAVGRFIYNTAGAHFTDVKPYCASTISPFNSQNTFFTRRVIPYYMCLPHIGRMDDIWGAYLLQHLMPDCHVVFNTASVFQERNLHNITKDFEQEVIGYTKTATLLNDLSNYESYIPEETIVAYDLYRTYFPYLI